MSIPPRAFRGHQKPATLLMLMVRSKNRTVRETLLSQGRECKDTDGRRSPARGYSPHSAVQLIAKEKPIVLYSIISCHFLHTLSKRMRASTD